MKKHTTTTKPRALARLLNSTFTPALALLALTSTVFAGSATWKASPATGDWNTASNWTTGGPSNGATDTATFATSNKTGISLSATTEVNGIVFNSGASAFTITSALLFTINGNGITNNSGITQNFVLDASSYGGEINFQNSATAGSNTSFTLMAGVDNTTSGGSIFFNNNSTAGSGTFTLNGKVQLLTARPRG